LINFGFLYRQEPLSAVDCRFHFQLFSSSWSAATHSCPQNRLDGLCRRGELSKQEMLLSLFLKMGKSTQSMLLWKSILFDWVAKALQRGSTDSSTSSS
jgi:hypothetical protein